jgi:hypothetical protein
LGFTLNAARYTARDDSPSWNAETLLGWVAEGRVPSCDTIGLERPRYDDPIAIYRLGKLTREMVSLDH